MPEKSKTLLFHMRQPKHDTFTFMKHILQLNNMKHIKSTYLAIVLIVASIVLLSLTSCSKKKWTETTEVTFRGALTSDQVVLANNPFIFDTLNLNISSLNLTGKRLQAEDVNLIQSANNTLSLNNNSVLSTINIPQGTFEEMNIQYQITPDNDYSFFISGHYYLNSGAVNEVKIKLNLNQFVFHGVNDSDGSSTILLESDNSRNLNIILNTEVLFSEVNNGLWNAANVTSISGANTIQVDVLNNQSIYLAINNQISNAITTQFE